VLIAIGFTAARLLFFLKKEKEEAYSINIVFTMGVIKFSDDKMERPCVDSDGN